MRAGGGLETAGRSADRRLRPRGAGGPQSGSCSSARKAENSRRHFLSPCPLCGRSTSRPWAGDGLPRCFPAPRCKAILRRARRDRRLFIARQRKTGGGAHPSRRFRPPGTRARGRGATARRRGPLRAPRRAWRESPGIALFGAGLWPGLDRRGRRAGRGAPAAGRHPAAIVFCRRFPFSVRAERGAGPVRRSSAPRRAALRGPPLSPLLPGPGFFHLPGPASFFAVGGRSGPARARGRIHEIAASCRPASGQAGERVQPAGRPAPRAGTGAGPADRTPSTRCCWPATSTTSRCRRPRRWSCWTGFSPP